MDVPTTVLAPLFLSSLAATSLHQPWPPLPAWAFAAPGYRLLLKHIGPHPGVEVRLLILRGPPCLSAGERWRRVPLGVLFLLLRHPVGAGAAAQLSFTPPRRDSDQQPHTCPEIGIVDAPQIKWPWFMDKVTSGGAPWHGRHIHGFAP